MLGTDNLPGSPELHPIVRKLDLITVSELLLEQPVLIVDAITDGRQIQGGERIEETGGKTA